MGGLWGSLLLLMLMLLLPPRFTLRESGHSEPSAPETSGAERRGEARAGGRIIITTYTRAHNTHARGRASTHTHTHMHIYNARACTRT